MTREQKRKKERDYYHKTKERRKQLNKERYRQNPKAFAVTNKRSVLKRKYNLSLEEYEQRFAAQDGKCAICGGSEIQRLLAVDHNHQTNQVRALLCGNCNRGLGLFKDSLITLQKAVDYLTAYGGSD